MIGTDRNSRRGRTRSLHARCVGILLAILPAIGGVGCGGTGDDPASGSADASVASLALDACALLAASASGVLGEAAGEPMRGIQNAGGERTAAISSCSYDTPAGRSLDLMVRRSPERDNTAGAIANVREGAAALGALEDVADLGDAAFAVRFSGERAVQLHVFWGGNRYQMVTVNGFDHDAGIERAKSVARAVIDQL